MSDIKQFGEFPPMLEKMQKAIRSHPWWKKRIDGTPLDNDLAVRCAEVAVVALSNANGASVAELSRLRTRIADLEEAGRKLGAEVREMRIWYPNENWPQITEVQAAVDSHPTAAGFVKEAGE